MRVQALAGLAALILVTGCADGFFGPNPTGIVYDLRVYHRSALPALDTQYVVGGDTVRTMVLMGQVLNVRPGFGGTPLILTLVRSVDSAGITSTRTTVDTGKIVVNSGPYGSAADFWCQRRCVALCDVQCFSPGLLLVTADSDRIDVPHMLPDTVTVDAANNPVTFVREQAIYAGGWDYHFVRH